MALSLYTYKISLKWENFKELKKKCNEILGNNPKNLITGTLKRFSGVENPFR